MIDVRVHSTLRTRTEKTLLVKAARAALTPHMKHAAVAVAVIGEKRMRAVNRDALGHDYVTDVLSFDHGNTPEGRMMEIVVCAPFAEKQARAHGVPAKQELARYVVHGCLHCAGFKDNTEPERKRMWKAQEQTLKKLFGRSYAAGKNHA
jgi:probable rRNA maturation factor